MATRVGVNVYCYEILRALASLDEDFSLRIYLDKPPRDDFPVRQDQADIRVLPAGRLWTLRRLSRELRRDPPDAFLVPTMQFPLFAPCPKVAPVHETAFMYLTECWNAKRRRRTILLTRLVARRADHVMAISQAVRDDLVRLFHARPERITVAHYGVSEELHPCTDAAEIARVRKKYSLPERYFLFVGRLSPRKNIVRLIEAFESVRARHPGLPHKLVIAGDKGWLFEEIFERAERSPAKEAIQFLGYVSREDVPVLISEADLLALVALWEGFGIPVIEAMACGTAVLTSDRSALAEVAGDAALRVDPYDVSAIAEGLERMLVEETARKEWEVKGLEHVRKFTWEDTARKTLDALRSVAKPRQAS